MNSTVRDILIVGGGTAGWLCAALLARRHGAGGHGGVTITLIESSDIPTIGVGEGTWPTMRNTLHKIGIDEANFLNECSATFKQGSQFVNWRDSGVRDAYFHPFNPPRGVGQIDLAAYWCQHSHPDCRSFASSVDAQVAICEAGLAPKQISTPQYQGLLNYAYHLDAGKFAELLKAQAVNTLGVRHLVDTITHVTQHPNGDIASVVTTKMGEINADFFVDCSGFAALLIGKTLKVPSISLRSVLFADSAIAMQVPYPHDHHPIACQTIATAQAAGWIWDIGLRRRRGVGHVYSSAHMTRDEAEECLRLYIGPQSEDLEARHIPIDAGHRQVFWKNNCVAIGLAAGFLEPLEASALMLVELSAEQLSERLPINRDDMNFAAKYFNRVFLKRWQGIVEFLKLHYALSHRREAFWQDHRHAGNVPESLTEKLSYWRFHLPSRYEFDHDNDVFSWISYQYVLLGMGYANSMNLAPMSTQNSARAQLLLDQIESRQSQLLTSLLPHRELLEKIDRHGLQKI